MGSPGGRFPGRSTRSRIAGSFFTERTVSKPFPYYVNPFEIACEVAQWEEHFAGKRPDSRLGRELEGQIVSTEATVLPFRQILGVTHSRL